MSPKEAAILTHLVHAGASSFHALRELGACRGSHHTVTASRMEPKGWVERRNDGKGVARPSWSYRITAGGQQALYNHFMPKIAGLKRRQAAVPTDG